MTCPNDDPRFTQLLRRFLGEDAASPRGRRTLFYLVCLPVRILIFFTLYMFPNLFVPLFRLGAAIAAGVLFRSPQGGHWWSKEFDAMVASVVVIAPQKSVPWMFLVSIIGGLLESAFIEFC